MGKFTVGDVVLVLFPFSNLKGQKVRPALIVANAEFNNLILCQITSKPYASKISIRLTQTEFITGGLPVISFIRPDKLFTADAASIKKGIGTVTLQKRNHVLGKISGLFLSSSRS